MLKVARQPVIDATVSLLGMPFKGFGLFGYDNMKKKYVTVWADETDPAMAKPAIHTPAILINTSRREEQRSMGDIRSGRCIPLRREP